ncbi:MAG TPA: substrate-binding domain-containing protein [Candidatus Hydrogenedentes bacterium]|nr:substrate-binding domain-containing protein [Candidatus Hydrogenedentota bacterium]
MKKIWGSISGWTWIIGLLACTALPGFVDAADSAAPAPVTAVFLTDGQGWMVDFGKALSAALAEENITLRVAAPALPLPESQSEKLRELNGEDVSVLLVWPANPVEPKKTFDGATLSKPVILLGTDAPASGRKAAVTIAPEALGQKFAELIRQCVPDGLLIGMLARKQDAAGMDTLRKTLEEGLKEGEITLRQIAEDGGDPGAARENARELLEKHPELAGYVGMEPYHLTALAAAATDAKRNGYVGLVGMGWPETLGEPLEKGFINGVVFPNPQELASVLVPMIRAAASGDGSYAWPESGKVAMPLATRFVPKPYGVTEMIHGLPGNWNIKLPEGKPEPSPGKFD